MKLLYNEEEDFNITSPLAKLEMVGLRYEMV